MNAQQLEADSLAEQVKLHKQAIRKHRVALHSCKDALAELRKVCEQHGIALIVEPKSVGSKPHGVNRDNRQ